MNTLSQDLRYGLRMLLKHKLVTAIAVITLALGIGANTAIFSVVNAVLLNPLPYKQPDRLVALWSNVPGHGRWRNSPATFFDWKKQNTVFEDVVAFGASTMTLTVVGVEPILGRAFLPEEYETGKDQVIILSYNFWQHRFGGDKNIINRTLTLDGDTYTVVGVMPPGIYPVWPTTSGHITFDEQQQQYWHPMSFTPGWAAVRTAHVFGVLARMKPGITLAQ